MFRREVKEAITCSVCAEAFSLEDNLIPRILTCGHSFCDGCLKKLEKQRRTNKEKYVCVNVSRYKRECTISVQYEITCPKCKKKTISDNPSSDLPKNYAYLELMDEVLKSTVDQFEFCHIHPSYVLDMFCHEEEEAVCLNCTTYGQHKSHKVSKLSWFSDQQEAHIKEKIGCLNNVIKQYKKLQEDLKERQDYLDRKSAYAQETIASGFSNIQSQIKSILDAKQEFVLTQLAECTSAQAALLEKNEELLLSNTQKLEGMRDRANDFLDEADECRIAKEKDLLVDIQECLEEAQNYEMVTSDVYKVQMEKSDHIVQSVKEMVDAWVCNVGEGKQEPLAEPVTTLLEKQQPCLGDSLNVMFDEEQDVELSVSNMFGEIDSELWCDGELQQVQFSEAECDPEADSEDDSSAVLLS